jgi:hypothetical protein
MSQGYSYQMIAGDPRIWVFDGTTLVGHKIDGKFVPLATEYETDKLLMEALKRKPDK